MSSSLQLRLRIDFAPGCSVGPGKVALLEAIQRCGSLSEAARQIGMSYRRAWLLLAELNRSFNQPLATTAVGGSHGGGAELTAFGQEVIAAFRAVEREANTLARRRLSQVLSGVKSSGVGPSRVKAAAKQTGTQQAGSKRALTKQAGAKQTGEVKARARSLARRRRSA